jgi:hypothetical protein
MLDSVTEGQSNLDQILASINASWPPDEADRR